MPSEHETSNDRKKPKGILVKVNYQERTEDHSFSPRTTVGAVLDWAIQIFSVDPAIATELELTLDGSDEELPEKKHLGSLAHGEKSLCLDLVRGDMANG